MKFNPLLIPLCYMEYQPSFCGSTRSLRISAQLFPCTSGNAFDGREKLFVFFSSCLLLLESVKALVEKKYFFPSPVGDTKSVYVRAG